ncbi:TIGR04168 family protein [Pseudanabaena sp. FACHB-2040]|uniref:TIGR04168 family protein n=1 Tax=Pseudanabaena sp. FACHB-2040 TaxID=2692859 RepID=UPI001689C112|nr:TIGR04168 family protein [Pseudanabaena sp. FACHB-2040]MBD2258874.1 TIGR04168 family protein [Pseudanabaena sp. FACHB-2040]
MNSSPSQIDRAIRIAVVGDVHDQWSPEDAIALHHLAIDLVLFVGDFGNEAVGVVRQIAALEQPKAAIFGNHDAWYTATDWGRKKRPYDPAQEDWVQTQVDLLGECHVGYGKLDFPQFGLTVVGGRPFSWGGSEWKNKTFYANRYNVHGFAESAERIVASVQAAAHETVIFIGHCGPTGLGDQPEDICGRDWKPLGGDHGDPDLAEAIAAAQALGKQIPLVTFGHMHHGLRHRKDRLRQRLLSNPDGTVYLNAASVPRIVQTPTDCQRTFSVVTLKGGQVDQVCQVWVNQFFEVCSQEVLHQATETVAMVP